MSLSGTVYTIDINLSEKQANAIDTFFFIKLYCFLLLHR